MTWMELATADLDGRTLALYRGEDGAYMVRVDGLELMNGRWHRSEDELGALAAAFAPRASPRVLLGGLGLGYTLAALARGLGGDGQITVAEISPQVVAWYERWFEPALFASRPPGVTLRVTDVASLLRGEPEYDVILLDVDNGPEPLSAAGNAFLYGAEGLRALHASLAEGGVLLLWSGFEAPAFVARAVAAGFAVDIRRVAYPERRDLEHFIYLLSRVRGRAAPQAGGGPARTCASGP
jgi:spermidine synthase